MRLTMLFKIGLKSEDDAFKKRDENNQFRVDERQPVRCGVDGDEPDNQLI